MRIRINYSDGRWSWYAVYAENVQADVPSGVIGWGWRLVFTLAARLDYAVQHKLRELDNAWYAARETDEGGL